jgi:hypothetical protein
MPAESFQFDQFREIARGRRRRRVGDRSVIRCAQPGFEAIRPFSEHADQGLLLPSIYLPAKTVEQLRFGKQEVDPIQRALLGFKRDAREPVEPFINVIGEARSL